MTHPTKVRLFIAGLFLFGMIQALAGCAPSTPDPNLWKGVKYVLEKAEKNQ